MEIYGRIVSKTKFSREKFLIESLALKRLKLILTQQIF